MLYEWYRKVFGFARKGYVFNLNTSISLNLLSFSPERQESHIKSKKSKLYFSRPYEASATLLGALCFGPRLDLNQI